MMNSTLVRRYVRFPLRTVRYRMRRLQYRLRYGRTDTPIFFANSFPKSGTHLLLQAIQGFARLGPVIYSGLPAVTMYEAFSGARLSEAQVASQINQLRACLCRSAAGGSALPSRGGILFYLPRPARRGRFACPLCDRDLDQPRAP
jgi:hypothetical protein